MSIFKNKEQGEQVVELLKQYGYDRAKYTFLEGSNYEDFNIGSSPNRYINLRFETQRGFHMTLSGTWVEGEEM